MREMSQREDKHEIKVHGCEKRRKRSWEEKRRWEDGDRGIMGKEGVLGKIVTSFTGITLYIDSHLYSGMGRQRLYSAQVFVWQMLQNLQCSYKTAFHDPWAEYGSIP